MATYTTKQRALQIGIETFAEIKQGKNTLKVPFAYTKGETILLYTVFADNSTDGIEAEILDFKDGEITFMVKGVM